MSTTPEGRCIPPPPKRKFTKTRHPPAPGTRNPVKEVPGILPHKKVCISPSCSSCHPVRLKNQDSKTTRTEKYKLLNLVEMKVCISGLTLTQNPNPQKNKSCLKGLGFRVRVRPETQTFEFGGNESLFFWPTPPRTTHPLEDDSL